MYFIFRTNDYCYLRPNNQDVVHESLVHLVKRDAIIVKITKRAKEAWYEEEREREGGREGRGGGGKRTVVKV